MSSDAARAQSPSPAWGPPRGWRRWTLWGAPPACALAAAVSGGLAGLGAAPLFAPAAAVMLGILLLCAIYWATEAVSPLATALLAIGLCVALLGVPATWGQGWATTGTRITGYTDFIAPAGSSVMLLMLGSLVLALGAHRTGLDRAAGRALLAPLASSPARLVAGVLCISAFLSMWTSNTATAAIMLAVTRPLWGNAALPASLRAAVPLAMAVGANVGGIASPVGTPPNAIVFARLQEMGHPLNFVQWLGVGLPLAAGVLAVGYLALRWALPLPRAGEPDAQGAPLDIRAALLADAAPGAPSAADAAPRWARAATLGVFVLTVLLWLTGPWTSVPVAAAALAPLVLLPLLGILRPVDFAHLEWDVLLLILGGLVLGEGIERSGLAAQAVALLPTDALSPLGLVALLATVAAVLSAFMSNTATANLLTPVAMSIAVALASGDTGPGAPNERWLATHAGLAVALGSGMAMMLPVSTPANAMAARSGEVPTRLFLIVGGAVGLTGVAAVVLNAALRG
jgi:sodium-dependent dicarboxylate transporter 2/3/5